MLIDPREPAADKLAELEAGWGGKPVASLLTNAWQERDCYGFREGYGTPMWSAKAGEAEHEGEPDHLFAEGDELPGGIEAVVLSDQFCGDTVFFWTAPDGERVAFVGDAVSAQIRDGEIDVYLQIYGRPTLDEYRAAFRRVAEREIDLMCLAHGGCIADVPGERLRHTLENDQLYRNDWPGDDHAAARAEAAGVVIGVIAPATGSRGRLKRSKTVVDATPVRRYSSGY